jgi:hypothetical protein
MDIFSNILILMFFGYLVAILCGAAMINHKIIRCVLVLCICAFYILFPAIIVSFFNHSFFYSMYSRDIGIILDTLHESSKTNDIQVLQDQLLVVLGEAPYCFANRITLVTVLCKIDADY